MANIFLSVPQYKQISEAEIQRIKKELNLEEWETNLKGFHPMFDVSISNLFNANHHRVRYCCVSGDGNLPRARAFSLGIWRQEYDTDLRSDYFMIVDEDISFTPDAIDFLIEADKPIIGGIYTFKSKKPNYVGKVCSRFLDDYSLIKTDQPFPVRWLNGGFIMCKAEFLLDMIDKYKDLEFEVAKYNETHIDTTWALWCPFVYDRTFLSEDWAFCQRARDIGYEIWGDVRFKLIHWAAEFGYAIHFGEDENEGNLREGDKTS